MGDCEVFISFLEECGTHTEEGRGTETARAPTSCMRAHARVPLKRPAVAAASSAGAVSAPG